MGQENIRLGLSCDSWSYAGVLLLALILGRGPASRAMPCSVMPIVLDMILAPQTSRFDR